MKTREERLEALGKFYRENRGTVWGAAAGLVIAVLLLTAGFWRTLLITLLVAAGIAVGRTVDRGKTEERKEQLAAMLRRKNK